MIFPCPTSQSNPACWMRTRFGLPAGPTVRSVFGDPEGGARRHPTLVRRSKKGPCSGCGQVHSGWYDRKLPGGRRIFPAATRGCFSNSRGAACLLPPLSQEWRRRARLPGRQPAHCKRFAFYVGATLSERYDQGYRQELALDWHTVKAAGEAVHGGAVGQGEARRDRRPSASTRSRSPRATPTGSW